MLKELRHLLRDRQTLAILLLLPLAQVLLFGHALRNDIRTVRVVIVDADPDFQTVALRNRLVGNGRIQVVAQVPTTDAIESFFRRGAADVALIFQTGFAKRFVSGPPSQLLIVTDAADPNTGTRMAAYVGAVVEGFQADLGARAGMIRIEPRVRMRYNPMLESVNLFVPGLIALVLTLISSLMTAISLSREKERGTLEVLLVSPLRPWQIVLGKVLPYLLLAFANALTALLAARIVFHVPFRGSFVLFIGAALLYSMVGLALGVVVAAVTSSQRTAMIGALVGTMLPSALLSGMIFPISSLPGWLQTITLAIPARWFIVIARGIMLKGVGLTYLWQELLILTAMLIVLGLAALRAFKPRIA